MQCWPKFDLELSPMVTHFLCHLYTAIAGCHFFDLHLYAVNDNCLQCNHQPLIALKFRFYTDLLNNNELYLYDYNDISMIHLS